MKRRSLLQFIANSLLLPVTKPAHAEEITLNENNTAVNFSVKAGMWPVFLTKHGTFQKLEGTLGINGRDIKSVTLSVTLHSNSIHLTDAPDYDEELRGTDFFNAEKDHDVTFNSKRIDQTGANTAILSGDIIVRGHTEHLALNVKYTEINNLFDVVATGSINRRHFGMTSKSLVGDDVELQIHARAILPLKPPELRR